ncbi:MAG: choice-of-anchor Q domain-containing protein [Chloroflexota bacterium]
MKRMQKRSKSPIDTIISSILPILLVLSGIYFLTAAPPVSAQSCVVSSTADVGGNSLRGLIAVGLAGGCTDNTITFDPNMANETITVASPLAIEVPGQGTLNIISDVPVIVSGGNATQVFTIGFDETVSMAGFTIANGSFDGVFTRDSSDILLQTYRGGGIEMQDSVDLTLTNMVLDNNEAFVGGAIFNRGTSVLTITDTTFSSNRSRSNGGAISSNLGSINIDNSTFVGNDSNASGGAIQHFSNTGQNLNIRNSTFTENAGKQGVIFVDESTANISHITMVANQVRVGALYADFNGTINVQNSIIYDISLDPDSGNLATGGACVASDVNGGFFVATNNIVPNDNTLCQSTAASTADPQVGTLGNNGGPTLTMALLEGSSAIDSANVAFCPATDQRGVSRPQPEGGACDIGAFEFQAELPVIEFGAATYSATEGDGTVDVTLVLNEAAPFDLTATVSVANQDDLSVDAATEEVQTITIDAGSTSQTVTITIPDDVQYEGSRGVDLEITGVDAAAIGEIRSAVLTIADNDALPVLTVVGATGDEADANTTLTFVITLDQAAAIDISADYAVSGDSATIGSDFQAAAGTLVIPAGQTAAQIEVVVVGDDVEEEVETFNLTLSNLVNAQASPSGLEVVGTINDDDVTESDPGTVYMPMMWNQ